jgi:tetratricopeptide (TPR) repeat protein
VTAPRVLTLAACCYLLPMHVRADDASAQADPLALLEKGKDLCNDGKWAEALPIYRELVKTHPANAWAWMGLGWSLHYTGKYEEAIPAYRRGYELGAIQPSRPWLETARCYAALGRKDEALRALERALAEKLPNLAPLRSDKRLELLRGEAQFRELLGIVDTAGLSRDDGWRADIRFLAREVRRLHHQPFRVIPEKEFDREVQDLLGAVPSLSDEAITVRIMKLVCRLGDGHSYAEAPFQQGGARRRALPVLFGLLDDGLYVTATAAGHEELLWAEVTRIEGTPVAKVCEAMNAIAAQDNPMRPKSVVPGLLRYPQLLKGLGLSADAGKVRLGLTDRQGRAKEVTLAVAEKPVADWVRKPAEVRTDLPTHVRRRADYYWFEYFPRTKLVYVQYNACANMEGETLEAFCRRLFAFVEANDVAKLVLDLRWNGGGNMFVNRPLLDGLVRLRKANRRGELFVIVGRHTFSAAMILAAQIERYTEATFVGEPTGSSPNFVGETCLVELPFSKVEVSISDLAWQNSHAKDYRVWIDPALPVPFTFRDWKAGRDAALERIEAYRRQGE